MNRRARLTLISVCLVAMLAGVFSAYYLKTEIERQFKFAFDRADLMKRVASDNVARSLESQSALPSPEAQAINADLTDRLRTIMAVSRSLLEITVCDPANKVLLSTDASRHLGDPFPEDYPDYSQLALGSRLIDKIRVLKDEGSPKYYQLTEALGAGGQRPELFVHVVILPALIRNDILPELQKALVVSLLSIIGSILATLVFSKFAFQPLSNVTKMLDHLSRGEYESPAQAARPREKQDEFGAMVSKVNLIGQQLGNFERLLDQLEEAVLVFGADRNLIVASGALEKFLGKRRLELMGLTMMDIFPPDASVGFFLDQILETGRPVRNFPVRLGSGDGAETNGAGKTKLSHALLSVELLESFASGTRKNAGVLVRLRDPEVRRQIKGQLQTAERLTAINRVTSGVAHEVKNPLNAILMHVELAKIKLAKGDFDVGPQMDIVGSEILRLDRVVKTFLDFTRPVEIKSADVVVDAFVSEIADLARPQAQAVGVTVSVDLNAPGATMVVDPDLLKQAALNVVVNAIEAMPQGGELRFESSIEGEEAEIRISDSGTGIPPEKREKIFQLYFTTKKKGSGIGLAMTFRIVQLHNGKIDFFSEPGKGTTFVLSFSPGGFVPMKLDTTSFLFTACCGLALVLSSCEMLPAKASAKPAVPTPRPAAAQPAPPEETASDLPVSVPQTQVTLPSPQPIEAAALATILPDSPPPPGPPNPTVRPTRAPARSEPRQPATVAQPPATVALPPAATPATPPPSRRLRPVEPPAERQRLMTEIAARQRQVQDALAKAKTRQLSDKDKSAVERIQSFLEQTETALKDEDFQQAEALSSRALLLTQDLSDK